MGAANVDLGCLLQLSDGTPVKDVYTTPAFLVNLIVSNLFVIAAVILFLLIFYSGFLFISGGTKGKDQAKGIITSAITGFILMFSAYWVVQIIKALTGVDVGI